MNETLRCCLVVICALALIANAGAAPDILIEDFELADYGDWTVTGTAFGDGPAEGTLPGQMEVRGYLGERLVNSFNGGDGPTGTLTSPQFTIERPYINFLIGGGGWEGETCINLIIGTTVARTATGTNPGGTETEELLWHSWNVEQFQGATARIQIVDDRSGAWGHINIDHIVQSDEQPELPEIIVDAEREIFVEEKYLIFPVDHNAPNRQLVLEVAGKRVREMEVPLSQQAEPDFWVFTETDDFAGTTITLRANILSDGQVSSFEAIRDDNTYPGKESVYTETLRPQLHFSSIRGWNNDPNGMVYYDGEFHLFYQHNPYGWDWGNMTWGHAVSTDLVHWTELGDAIHPDEYGTIFSGSGVIDHNNTTGFQTGDDPPMVVAFTYAGDHNEWSAGQPFTQGIAYSNDRGRTWTKYEGNPVQEHIVSENRDPKVIWHEETQAWIIILFLEHEDMAIFRSDDLKEWELQSELEAFHECPELFKLPVDGDEDNMKWVLYGASGDYYVGDFDGYEYTPDEDAIPFQYGNCFYASQTFNNVPEEDGRRIQITWGTNPAPGMPFNQMMGFPVVLTLRDTFDGIRMFANPVEEIERLYTVEHTWENIPIPEGGTKPLWGVEGELFDIEVEFDIVDAQEVGLNIRGQEIVYRTAARELRFDENTAPMRMLSPGFRIKLRCIVDRTSLEIFANDGRVYMPCQFRPEADNHALALFSRGGRVNSAQVKVRQLESIWGVQGPDLSGVKNSEMYD